MLLRMIHYLTLLYISIRWQGFEIAGKRKHKIGADLDPDFIWTIDIFKEKLIFIRTSKCEKNAANVSEKTLGSEQKWDRMSRSLKLLI